MKLPKLPWWGWLALASAAYFLSAPKPQANQDAALYQAYLKTHVPNGIVFQVPLSFEAWKAAGRPAYVS